MATSSLWCLIVISSIRHLSFFSIFWGAISAEDSGFMTSHIHIHNLLLHHYILLYFLRFSHYAYYLNLPFEYGVLNTLTFNPSNTVGPVRMQIPWLNIVPGLPVVCKVYEKKTNLNVNQSESVSPLTSILTNVINMISSWSCSGVRALAPLPASRAGLAKGGGKVCSEVRTSWFCSNVRWDKLNSSAMFQSFKSVKAN